MNKIGFNVLAWSGAVSAEIKPNNVTLQNIGFVGV